MLRDAGAGLERWGGGGGGGVGRFVAGAAVVLRGAAARDVVLRGVAVRDVVVRDAAAAGTAWVGVAAWPVSVWRSVSSRSFLGHQRLSAPRNQPIGGTPEYRLPSHAI